MRILGSEEVRGLVQGHDDHKRQKQKAKPVLLVPRSFVLSNHYTVVGFLLESY